MSIIEVNHVTKEYQLGQIQGLKTTVLNQWRRLTGQPSGERAPFKALDDVHFSIEPGEVVGIIGHNGAGKSTMLKLLANISKPSSGSITVKGKIAPLIEVGAGLIGDLTGRENIYLNGAILGIAKAEIKRKFDDIVAFAELEEFIDTPIKRYSSGMQVRLGFSIATSVESDILIVDEVLAVGDLAFQRKCFDRMEDLIKRQGKTVLLVSHNIRQIGRICSRVIMLDHGKIVAEGEPEYVCQKFYEQANEKIHTQTKVTSRVQSSGEVSLQEIAIVESNGTEVQKISAGNPLMIRVKIHVRDYIDMPQIVIGTHTTDFVYLHAGSTAIFDDRPSLAPGEHCILFVTPTYPMATGTYCVRFSVYAANHRPIFVGEALHTFMVVSTNSELKLAGSRMLELQGSWLIDDAPLST